MNQFTAAERGNLRWFLQNTYDVNDVDEFGETALSRAARNGHCNVVVELIKAGAFIQGCSGAYALIGACIRGHSKVANALIQAGVNVNHRFGCGSNALSWAVGWNNLDVISELLRLGIKDDLEDFNGNTALDNSLAAGYENSTYIIRLWQRTPRSLKHTTQKCIKDLSITASNTILLRWNSFERETNDGSI